MKALLIVDVQSDFMPGGALGIEGAHRIIPVINSLIPMFNCVVATKDWHPPNHVSFATRHRKYPGEKIEVEKYTQELWPEHCIQETPGSDFFPDLQTEKIRKVFFKGIELDLDSYSAFFDNAHHRSTGLGEYLKEIGVDKLYITGLATDYCVKYSVLDALELGFDVYVIEDACQGIEQQTGDIARALETLKSAGAHIINSTWLRSS